MDEPLSAAVLPPFEDKRGDRPNTDAPAGLIDFSIASLRRMELPSGLFCEELGAGDPIPRGASLRYSLMTIHRPAQGPGERPRPRLRRRANALGAAGAARRPRAAPGRLRAAPVGRRAPRRRARRRAARAARGRRSRPPAAWRRSGHGARLDRHRASRCTSRPAAAMPARDCSARRSTSCWAAAMRRSSLFRALPVAGRAAASRTSPPRSTRCSRSRPSRGRARPERPRARRRAPRRRPADRRCSCPTAAGPGSTTPSAARVVERYEVYSVHQDAMAPMALLELCGGHRRRALPSTPSAHGLRWIHGRNELGARHVRPRERARAAARSAAARPWTGSGSRAKTGAVARRPARCRLDRAADRAQPDRPAVPLRLGARGLVRPRGRARGAEGRRERRGRRRRRRVQQPRARCAPASSRSPRLEDVRVIVVDNDSPDGRPRGDRRPAGADRSARPQRRLRLRLQPRVAAGDVAVRAAPEPGRAHRRALDRARSSTRSSADARVGGVGPRTLDEDGDAAASQRRFPRAALDVRAGAVPAAAAPRARLVRRADPRSAPPTSAPGARLALRRLHAAAPRRRSSGSAASTRASSSTARRRTCSVGCATAVASVAL